MSTKCPKCQFKNPAGAVFCAKCATRIRGHIPDSPESGTCPQNSKMPSPGLKGQISATRTLETTPGGLGKGELFAGRFEMIEELGAGGMGIVYRAYDKKVGEEVALKILHPEIALEERTVDRFRNEIKLARRISHRNVCRMHELHEDGKQLFITMEYVSGQDLKGLIKEARALTAGRAISIAKQVAEGLAEAHHLSVIHRDLKPQNIMVDKEGLAKIMDFGIARSLRTAGVTAEGMIIGTPEYMAPEQVEGLEADQRTDIYALGAILFEMVTGRVPFEGDSPLSVAYKHKNELPLPPRKLNAQIPEPFNQLILRCLEKEKENRYQTADELLTDLVRIEEGLPISDRVALPARPTIRISREKPTGLKRLAIPALGIIVLALAAFIALRVLPKKPPVAPSSASGKPSIAVLYFENLTGDPALEAWKTGLAEILIAELSQSKFIRVLDPNKTYGILKKFNLDQAKKYSREDLIKVAKEGGTAYTASGSLMKAGESIIIMLTLQKPRIGEVVDSVKLTCRNESEILPKTDELTAKIKSSLNLPSAQLIADAGPGAETIYTTSTQALKYYLEALKAYRSWDIEKVAPLCEKAIAIAPQFASAYLMLAVMHEKNRDFIKGRELRKKAFDLRDRLPAKDRYLVEANYYLNGPEETTDKLLEAYGKYFELAPEDSQETAEERLSLSLTYSKRFEDYEKALEQMEMAYRGDQSHLIVVHFAEAYMRMGFYEKAENVIRDYLDSHEDDSSLHIDLSVLYLIQRKYEPALAEIEKASQLKPALEWGTNRGSVYHLRGDLAEAEKEYIQVLKKESGDDRNWARYLLNCLYLLQGKFSRAAEDLEKAMQPGGDLEKELQPGGTWFWSSPAVYIFLRSKKYEASTEILNRKLNMASELGDLRSQARTIWWKGIIQIDKKMPAEAEKTSAELKVLCEQTVSKKLIRYYDHLQGLIDLEKGNHPSAIASLERACLKLPYELGFDDYHAAFFYPLALAYYRAGDLEKARSEFEKITFLTTGRRNYGDLYAKSFYWLGKIGEEQKDKRRAAENYGKFLDLWKDADPGQPEVEDAKRKLDLVFK
jgi:serine/threonine protein kinase/tetratricopeptide (TPR) repeat protein